MLLEGHIRNGVVVFDEPVSLPDGTPVRVEPIEKPPEQPKSLLERLGDVIGTVDDLPADAALHVDHYLYGHPKK